MTLALKLLALVAVACVLTAHAEQTASPASELQDALNTMQDTLLTDVPQQGMEEGDSYQSERFDEHVQALENGGASWLAPENPNHMSLAETGTEAGVEVDMSLETGVDAEMEARMEAQAEASGIFSEGLTDLVAKGLISSDIGKRIIALNAERNPAPAKAKAKGKGKGKKGKKGKKGGAGGGADDKANSGATKVADVRGVDGKPLKSIQLVTGKNVVNSECFACQYFVQRTLGALLGPFYAPKNSGPHIPPDFQASGMPQDNTATPKDTFKQYTTASAVFESLDRSEEAAQRASDRYPYSPIPGAFGASYPYLMVESDAQAAGVAPSSNDEMSAIEIFAIVKEQFNEPSAEEALEQYQKWEHYLPAHMRVSLVETSSEVQTEADSETAVAAEETTQTEAEAEAETEADADRKKKKKKKQKKAKAAKKGKVAKKAKVAKKSKAAKKGKGAKKGKKVAAPVSKSLQSKYGQYYGRFQTHAVQAFFTDICNRRVPTEWFGVCNKLFKNLKAVTEELTVGDRPDEVCMRHKLCPKKSYVTKRSHSAMRQADPSPNKKKKKF